VGEETLQERVRPGVRVADDGEVIAVADRLLVARSDLEVD